MAGDIAEIGFSANTGELAEAKVRLEALSPAAGKAERGAARLNKMLNASASAATASARAMLLKANADLSAARASATATSQEIKAAQAAQRVAKASYDAAKASQAQANASRLAAVAAGQEATALDNAASAARRRASVPLVDGRSNSGGRGPWGQTPDNDNSPLGQSAGAFKANVGNIAAQFQDIGVTAAMGMNPLLIALQQGTQLSMAMGGGVRALGAALLAVFSPVALLTIALVAIGAALLQMVNWTSLAQTGLNALAAILPTVSQYIVAFGAAVAIAFAPAILTLFWNTFIAVAAGIIGLVGGIIAAIGAIPLALGLIVADLIIFREEWAQVLGVDLVGIAYKGVNLIIGAFVGAYHDIEFLWNQFPNVIGAAAIGAANMAIRAVNAIVAASITALNGLISSVNSLMTLGGIGEMLGVSGPIGTIDPSQFQFKELANTAADALAAAVGQRNTQLEKDLSADYLGAMGGAIGDAATAASNKIKEFSGGLDDVDAKKKKGGGAGGKTASEKFSDIVNGAERSIAALQAERDAIGLSEEATARLKHETELLNQAKQKNINLTPEQRSQLLGLAADMAKLEVATKRAQEALDFAKDITKGFISDLRSGLKNGESFWEAFSNAAMNALDKITDKLLNEVIDALFEVNSAAGGGGGGGGLFGIIAGLFGGGQSSFSFAPGLGLWAKGGAFENGISGHSNSVVSKPTLFAFASGAGLMGEAGPEAIMPLSRGPDGSLGVEAHGTGSSGPNVVVQVINNAPNTEVREERGTDENGAEIQRIIIDTVRQGTANGEFDDVNQARYNNRVQKVAR